MNACVCAAPAATSLWWPISFAVLVFVGAAVWALTASWPSSGSGELHSLRRALAVEALQRRRLVAVVREWAPTSEIAAALVVDPTEAGVR